MQRILPAWIAAEAEAVYDSGREAGVEVILDLAGRVERHEDRLRRLEERAQARAKAKVLMRREGERRSKAGG